MREYLVVYEWAGSNWSAYSPDMPGCIATGSTREEIERRFTEALEFHLEGLREAGLPAPEHLADAGWVRIAAQTKPAGRPGLRSDPEAGPDHRPARRSGSRTDDMLSTQGTAGSRVLVPMAGLLLVLAAIPQPALARAAMGGPTKAPIRHANHGDWLIVPGSRIGKVRLGETRPLEALIGHPQACSDEAVGHGWDYWYTALKPGMPRYELDVYLIRTETADNQVEQVRITSPAFRTALGIRAGSTLAQIRRRFPRATLTARYDSSDLPGPSYVYDRAKNDWVENLAPSAAKAHHTIYVYDDVPAGVAFEIPRSPSAGRPEDQCQAIVIHPRGSPVADVYVPWAHYTLIFHRRLGTRGSPGGR